MRYLLILIASISIVAAQTDKDKKQQNYDKMLEDSLLLEDGLNPLQQGIPNSNYRDIIYDLKKRERDLIYNNPNKIAQQLFLGEKVSSLSQLTPNMKDIIFDQRRNLFMPTQINSVESIEKKIEYYKNVDYKKEKEKALDKATARHKLELERIKNIYGSLEENHDTHLKALHDRLAELKKVKEETDARLKASKERIQQLRQISMNLNSKKPLEGSNFKSELEELKKSNMELKKMLLELKEEMKKK